MALRNELEVHEKIVISDGKSVSLGLQLRFECNKKAEPYKYIKKPAIPNIHSYLIKNTNCINYHEYIK